MRAILIALCFIVASCSSQAQMSGGVVRQKLDLPTAGGGAASPFRATRGSALPPPAEGSAPVQAAPPQGQGPGGIDFGQWRSADPAVYAPAFQTQIQARYTAGGAAARPDLERNGFTCHDRGGGSPAALECRLEIMEQQCAKEWYVVFEQARREPIAGFDVMCLGANR